MTTQTAADTRRYWAALTTVTAKSSTIDERLKAREIIAELALTDHGSILTKMARRAMFKDGWLLLEPCCDKCVKDRRYYGRTG